MLPRDRAHMRCRTIDYLLMVIKDNMDEASMDLKEFQLDDELREVNTKIAELEESLLNLRTTLN